MLLLTADPSALREWILGSVLVVVAGLATWLAKFLTGRATKTVDRMIQKLDEVVAELRNLARTDAKQEEQIKNIQAQVNNQQERLNGHSERIRHLESKH